MSEVMIVGEHAFRRVADKRWHAVLGPSGVAVTVTLEKVGSVWECAVTGKGMPFAYMTAQADGALLEHMVQTALNAAYWKLRQSIVDLTNVANNLQNWCQ